MCVGVQHFLGVFNIFLACSTFFWTLPPPSLRRTIVRQIALRRTAQTCFCESALPAEGRRVLDIVDLNPPLLGKKVDFGTDPLSPVSYLRICDLFFNLLSYMITPALVVLPVVVKFVVLRLQSDRWLWRVSTLMHIWCMAQGA